MANNAFSEADNTSALIIQDSAIIVNGNIPFKAISVCTMNTELYMIHRRIPVRKDFSE
jgi:hypothetical protein